MDPPIFVVPSGHRPSITPEPRGGSVINGVPSTFITREPGETPGCANVCVRVVTVLFVVPTTSPVYRVAAVLNAV